MKIAREAISFAEHPYIQIGNKMKDIVTVKNKEIYWIFIGKIYVKPIIIEKLTEIFDIPKEEWTDIFTIPRVIRNTKIKAFQYKVLFNLLPCNLYLSKIKRSDTNLCHICNELDDIFHYLGQCNQVKIFWDSFTNWWRHTMQEDLHLSLRDVFLGKVEKGVKEDALNACILLAKWNIYKNKLNESAIFFYNFLCDLKFFLINEKTIEIRNNRLARYNEMWLIVEDELT